MYTPATIKRAGQNLKSSRVHSGLKFMTRKSAPRTIKATGAAAELARGERNGIRLENSSTGSPRWRLLAVWYASKAM
jgi:ABC-type sulfate transport system substrate-binding protein